MIGSLPAKYTSVWRPHMLAFIVSYEQMRWSSHSCWGKDQWWNHKPNYFLFWMPILSTIYFKCSLFKLMWHVCRHEEMLINLYKSLCMRKKQKWRGKLTKTWEWTTYGMTGHCHPQLDGFSGYLTQGSARLW